MTKFAVKSYCQGLLCERPHHKQCQKAIFFFPDRDREAHHCIFSQQKADRADLALVQIEKSTCKSSSFDFTLTLTYTCALAVAVHERSKVNSLLNWTRTCVSLCHSLLPLFAISSSPLTFFLSSRPHMLSAQISHLLIQFSQINSSCVSFNTGSCATVTSGCLFCFIFPCCIECHISCGI